MSRSSLIVADAVTNLALGTLLMLFPREIVEFLGIPNVPSAFYPSILGAVLFVLAWPYSLKRYRSGGLGLLGAVAINLCGGAVLAWWLLFGMLSLPLRG